jgi:hypothetical protein
MAFWFLDIAFLARSTCCGRPLPRLGTWDREERPEDTLLAEKKAGWLPSQVLATQYVF